MQPPPTRWLAHTSMTDPGRLSALVGRLPDDVAALTRIVQGLLVHCEWLRLYGDDIGTFGPLSRTTLPVHQRLAALTELDGHGLDEAREPRSREIGTCRDFALMLCAFLRTKGMPARVRCGFAAYFRAGWEDHWVCEYWNARDSRWCLSDAQLDEATRSACGVNFDPSDMPREMFLTAGEAWLHCRAGHDDPERYGHGTTRGIGFMGVNVMRDTLVVNNRETSDWDRWREAPPGLGALLSEAFEALDRLASNPEQGPGELAPPWLPKAA